MFKNLSKALLGFVLATAIFAVPTSNVFALAGTGTANLSLSPSSGSHETGSTFSVAVKESSTQPVAGVEADLLYDVAKLECLGVDGGGSAFVQSYQGSCAGGKVFIARTTQGTTVSGADKLVATVNFRVLNATGTTKVTSAATSEIDSPTLENFCNATCADGAVLGTFSLVSPTPPATTPPASGGSTGGSTPAPKTTTKTQPKTGSTPVATNPTPAVTETQPAVEGATDTKKADDDKKDSTEPANKKASLGFYVLVTIAAIAAALFSRRMVMNKLSLKASGPKKVVRK